MRWRAWSPGPLLAGLALGGLMAAAVAGFRLPALRDWAAFPRLRALDYLPEPFRAIPPLRQAFIAEVLGSRNLERLLSVVAANAEESSPSGQSPRAGPRPSPQPSPPGPLAPVLGSDDWDLRVAMAADRATVAPGESILYTIVVRNVGTGDFRSQLTISAHTPLNTTYTEPSPCGPDGIDLDPEPCVQPAFPAPGTGEQLHVPSKSYAYGQGEDRLRAGEALVFAYRVTVNPGTPPGTELVNHAHLATASRPRADTPVVVVTVR